MATVRQNAVQISGVCSEYFFHNQLRPKSPTLMHPLAFFHLQNSYRELSPKVYRPTVSSMPEAELEMASVSPERLCSISVNGGAPLVLPMAGWYQKKKN